MADPNLLIALSAVSGIAILAFCALRGWRGWLELKRAELDRRDGDIAPQAGSRIEIANLKERIRKLEAIAAGVDL